MSTLDQIISTIDNMEKLIEIEFEDLNSEVKGINLNESQNLQESNERGRKREKVIINNNDNNNNNNNNNNKLSQNVEKETQGDHLNRIKAQRRQIRSATSDNQNPTQVFHIPINYERRSSSQPKSDSYHSPLKCLKQQTSAIYRTRAYIKKEKNDLDNLKNDIQIGKNDSDVYYQQKNLSASKRYVIINFNLSKSKSLS